jgi:hypothetical protein
MQHKQNVRVYSNVQTEICTRPTDRNVSGYSLPRCCVDIGVIKFFRRRFRHQWERNRLRHSRVLRYNHPDITAKDLERETK